jgi:hypothetical protein
LQAKIHPSPDRENHLFHAQEAQLLAQEPGSHGGVFPLKDIYPELRSLEFLNPHVRCRGRPLTLGVRHRIDGLLVPKAPTKLFFDIEADPIRSQAKVRF